MKATRKKRSPKPGDRPPRLTPLMARQQRSSGAARVTTPSGSVPDDLLRRLVIRTAVKIGPERLVRILSEVRAALKAENTDAARRAGNCCRMPAHREVMEQLLALARRGYYTNAANLALQAGLFAYEQTLDHLYAFYEYEHDIEQ